ncbi:hypothetical protein BXZ70DRAFT_962169 [Cristinia sonorae]|uniref:Uncharacterized protein n=1 Tax=Cristinia sonorae TaxID=1940300 RepID=A0A8K0UER2_9AGAR|nr:hypothetical protein BXZ70DRAFT_962169 [Cristinia sonorae]
MGRPLYSSSVVAPAVASQHATSPATPDVTIIRAPSEVAPDHPELSRWSYWNAFDPDADDFFDGPNAVYEAFVDPSSLPPLREEVALEEAGQTRRGLQVSDIQMITDLARSTTPLSDGSSSGSTTPALDDSYTVHLGEVQPLSHNATNSDGEVVEEASPAFPDSMPAPVIRRVLTPSSVPAEVVEVTRPVTPPRPSTPPAVNVTPLVYTPSPPPTVTPRLFTWAPRNFPASPLPNRNARMSVAHISPSYIPPAIVNRVQG